MVCSKYIRKDFRTMNNTYIPVLSPTLEFDDYKLLMHDRPSDIYNVMKDGALVGQIAVDLQCVKSNNGTHISLIPYDLRIRIIHDTEDLPIELFRKVILATVTLS